MIAPTQRVLNFCMKDADPKSKSHQATSSDIICNDGNSPGSSTLEIASGNNDNSRKHALEEYDFVFDSDEDVEYECGDELEPEKLTDDESQDELPVVRHKDEILELVKNNQVSIISGETGSGKTTKIPQFLVEAGYTKWGRIACTQPRRIAATSVAQRVAQEMGTKVGKLVGYKIRFGDVSSKGTLIKFLTDGLLLRECLTDSDLTEYSVIIIDEAHERTLNTDILLGLLKTLIRSRPELRIVISSATLKADKFSKYFNDAPVYTVPGRRFPVDIFYTKAPESDFISAALVTVFQLHLSAHTGPGDILVFLPGQEDIETVAESLFETVGRMGSKMKELLILPVYASLPTEQQERIFRPAPPGARKVILATNIAETSLTIDGVSFVIDSGLVKQKAFDAHSGMDSLVVQECSQASANQRAGRAGRQGPGKCYRLYTKWAFEHELPEETQPEILRTNLASVILLLLSIGVTNVVEFDFIDKPQTSYIVKALELLYSLGAINGQCQLTKIGRSMAELPVDPRMGKVILGSASLGNTEDVITVIAMLGELSTLFYRPKGRKEEADRVHALLSKSHGDHLTLLEVFNTWKLVNYSSEWCRSHYVQFKSMVRAREVRKQLIRLCMRINIDAQSSGKSIEKAFIGGYFSNIARLSQNGEYYHTLGTKVPVYIHPSSVLFGKTPKYILYNEIVVTSKEYMRACTEIEEEWIKEQAPHFYQSKVEKPRLQK